MWVSEKDIVEIWKKNKDKRGSFAALLTDLVAFYLTCLLPNYGLDMVSLELIYTYLGGRKQRVKTNDKYGESLFVVPQGFIMGLLLFNVFYATIFYLLMI